MKKKIAHEEKTSNESNPRPTSQQLATMDIVDRLERISAEIFVLQEACLGGNLDLYAKAVGRIREGLDGEIENLSRIAGKLVAASAAVTQ